MPDWNPAQYLKFESDRNKPIADLLNHVHLDEPGRVIDIGCGPGNSTGFLARRWPRAEVIGLDRSPAMLEKARQSYPELQWVEQDATGDLSALGKFDIVFSNAALQWLPEHERVIPNWFALLKPGGVLAVQLPQNDNSPLRQATQKLANSVAWRAKLPHTNPPQLYSIGEYYDILAKLDGKFELWTTVYHHVMDSHEDIMNWDKSKPFMNQLDAQDKEKFLAELLEQIQQAYPKQADGKILFDFQRLFFVVVK